MLRNPKGFFTFLLDFDFEMPVIISIVIFQQILKGSQERPQYRLIKMIDELSNTFIC